MVDATEINKITKLKEKIKKMTKILKKTLAIITAMTVWASIASPALALTAAELQVQIDALMAQLATLQTQLSELQGETPAITGCTITSFDQNLKQGMSGDDVKCLQIVLNSSADTQLAASGVGSPGNETSYFGPLTKAAVIKFQEKYTEDCLASWGLTVGTGFVGSTTRAKLNELLVGGVTPTGCECTAWVSDVCGGGDCTAAQMNQTRTCTIETGAAADACEGVAVSQCVADSSCVVAEGLTVTLAADTPAAAVVPSSATGVEFAKFTFSTDSGTATINSLVVHRYGVGIASELSNVYLYDGDSRLTGGRSVNADTHNVTFSNLSVEVSPTPKTLTVKADTAVSSSGVHGFEIVSSGDITTTESIAISGTFPVKANKMTLSTSAAGTATIAETTLSLSAYLGESAAEVAKFRITAGARDIAVKGITLTQGGVISNSDLANFVLKRGTTEVATADAIDSNDRLVLTLDSDYSIDAGVSRIFSLYADIIGGKTTDNIKFYVEEITDVNIIDEVYLVGAGITNNWALAEQMVTILGSTVTLGDNGPITGSVASDSTSVPILNYSVTVDRDVTVKRSTVMIEVKYAGELPEVDATFLSDSAVTVDGTTGAMTNVLTDTCAAYMKADMLKITSGGTSYYVIAVADCAGNSVTTTYRGANITGDAGAVVEVNPYTYIKNIKVVNLDGGTILGPTSYASSMTKDSVNDTFYSKAYTDSYDLAAETTTRFSIQVDVDNLMASGYAIYATIDYSATNAIKDVDANEYLASTDIVPNTLTSDAQTVTVSSLVVAKTATPVSNSFVVGQSNVPALGIALAAGSAKDLSVNKMILRLYGDDDAVTAFDNSLGDTAANTLVNSVTLVNSLTGATYGPFNLVLVDTGAAGYTSGADYYKVTFTNMGLTIPKSTNVGFVAKVNFKSTISGTNYLAVDLLLADIEAEDDTGSITPVGIAANLNLSTTPDPLITITGAGSLTVTVDAGTPDAAILVTNSASTASNVTKYKFHAENEAFVITGLKLEEVNGTSGSYDDDFTSVQITYPINAAGDLETKYSGFITGISTFAEDSIGIYVPKDDDAYLTIKVTTNSIADGADSGESPKIQLAVSGGYLTDEFIAVGQASGEKLRGNTDTITLDNTNVNEMVVRKTEPTLSKASAATTLSNGENILYALTVAADTNEDVAFRRVVFSSAISDAAVVGSGITVGYYTFYRGSTRLTADVTIIDQVGNDLTGAVTGAVSTSTTRVIVTFTGTKEEVVSAGGSNTYYLKATVGASAVGDSITFRIADDVTNLGSDVPVPTYFGVKTDATAGWSTTKATTGDYSVKLVQGSDFGNTYINITPLPGITLSDFSFATTLSGAWGYDYYSAETAVPWLYTYYRFYNPANSAQYVDLNTQTQKFTEDAWTTKDLTGTSTLDVTVYQYWDLQAATFGTNYTSFAAAHAAMDALIGGGGNEGLYDTWTLGQVRVYVNDTQGATVYVDNVVMDDVTYAMEPINFLWSDNNVINHTVNTLDWTNAYLVELLPADPLTLSR